MVVDVKDTTVISADGSTKKLGDYSGNVMLIVNVASYCGNTAQYKDLQKLHDSYFEKGLRIIAFPCNDFGKIFVQQNLVLNLKSWKRYTPKVTVQNLIKH